MITATTAHCWIAVGADGRPVWRGEHETHTATRKEAVDDIARHYPDRPDAAPKQMDRPCWIAVCECGSVYDEDGEGIEHWPNAEELTHLLRSIDYTVDDAGRVRCPDFCDCSCQPSEVAP